MIRIEYQVYPKQILVGQWQGTVQDIVCEEESKAPKWGLRGTMRTNFVTLIETISGLEETV